MNYKIISVCIVGLLSVAVQGSDGLDLRSDSDRPTPPMGGAMERAPGSSKRPYLDHRISRWSPSKHSAERAGPISKRRNRWDQRPEDSAAPPPPLSAPERESEGVWPIPSAMTPLPSPEVKSPSRRLMEQGAQIIELGKELGDESRRDLVRRLDGISEELSKGGIEPQTPMPVQHPELAPIMHHLNAMQQPASVFPQDAFQTLTNVIGGLVDKFDSPFYPPLSTAAPRS